MNPYAHSGGRFGALRAGRPGFTLVEMMTVLGLSALVAVGVWAALLTTLHQVRAGTAQLFFIAQARHAEQKITRYVQLSRACALHGTNTLDLFSNNNIRSELRFEDGDGDPATIEDNLLVFQTPGETPVVVCAGVSPLSDDEPLFRVLTPRAVQISFHLGDNPSEDPGPTRYQTGPGYQGVEVRLAVAARNIQTWYQK